jgi:hypothetical protein
MEYFDFYQNMVKAMKGAYGGDVIRVRQRGADSFYQGMYLACLLLFGKPGFMDVPAARHFAQKEAVDFLREAVFLKLRDGELKRLEELRREYGGVRLLTNPEMSFAVGLFERAAEL